MEGVLDPGRGVRLPPEALEVALVLRKEEFRRAVTVERIVAQVRMRGEDRPLHLAHVWLRLPLFGRPGVAKPERGEQMEPRRFGASVVDGDPDQDVLRAILGVLQHNVEIPVIVEDACIKQFVLELLPGPAPVRFDQVLIRKLPLRVFVEVLHVRVRRRRVDVEVVLLDVLAVVSLAVGQPEEAFLEDRVALVPKGERKAEALTVIRDAADPVFAPAISS